MASICHNVAQTVTSKYTLCYFKVHSLCLQSTQFVTSKYTPNRAVNHLLLQSTQSWNGTVLGVGLDLFTKLFQTKAVKNHRVLVELQRRRVRFQNPTLDGLPFVRGELIPLLLQS